MNGVVLIDKPSGCTSHDIVNRWRRLADTKRVGHLGTLDPMATGLLALVTGTATRLAQFFAKADKTYLAQVTLGAVSNTYDAEGEVTLTGLALPSSELLTSALEKFRGRFQQTPPPVSAKKVGGVRAYKLARQHLPLSLAPVEVEIKRLESRVLSPSLIELLITCSSGTYIRSIAHDLGQHLDCGALLSKLRRLRIGDFSIEAAKTLDELRDLAAAGRLHDAVIPSATLLSDIPAEYFDDAAVACIRQGRDFRTSPFVVNPGAPVVRALSRSGELIAIGELVVPNLYHPGTVL